MTTRKILVGLGAASVLTLGIAALGGASAQTYGGWGMMGGYGPDGGPDAQGWTCPGMGRGADYGPTYHMGGWRGGYGPHMMGYGYGRQSEGQTGENLNLTTDNVKARMERMLAWRGNSHLKLGDVKEKDADTITADVVTKDNSLVQRFDFNRYNGSYRPEED